MNTTSSNSRSLQLQYSRALERVDNWDEDICRLKAQMNRTDPTSVQHRGLRRRAIERRIYCLPRWCSYLDCIIRLEI